MPARWVAFVGAFATSLAIAAPGSPTFTSPSSTTFTAGVPNTFLVTTTGTPTPSIVKRGKKLPNGITFQDNHDGSGTLSGTPAGTGGNTAFKLVAQNSNGKVTQNFTLHVLAPPAITSAASTTCAIGVACTFTVTTTGTPEPTIVRSGDALPSMMTFVDNHNRTGTLSGTPAAGTDGQYSLVFTASNGVGSAAIQPFTLTVNKFLAITSPPSATCQAGTFCSFVVTATGIPTPTVSVSGGTLPPPMTYVDNGNGTGTVSGTPSAGTGGKYNLDFAAHNGVEPDAVQNFTLTVNEAPAITSIANSSCAIGVPCSFTVTATGFPVPTIGQTGDALPDDLLYADNGDGTGTISGTPIAGSNGSYALVFTATNGIGANAVQPFTLTVNLSLAISSVDATTCVVGSACTFTVTTSGVPVPSLVQSGATLPSTLAFVDNGNGTATLSGTADPGTGGIYDLVLTASNGVEPDAVQSFALTVNQVPQITSAASTTCAVGASCAFTVTTTGFPTPVIAHSGDTLPAALSFIDNGDGTAAISGTPSGGMGGTYNLVITASNGVAPDAVQGLTLVVTGSGPPLTLQSVVSRKTHGAAGTFDLPLSVVATNPTTEPRSSAVQHLIVFTFNKPVTAGDASVTAGVATAGTPTFSGSEMRVPLSGVNNQQYVTVDVNNVVAQDGETGGAASVRIGYLLGDVTQNRVVTVSDLGLVNAQVAQVVTAANYLKDVNASGTLTVADKAIANTQLTKALPAP